MGSLSTFTKQYTMSKIQSHSHIFVFCFLNHSTKMTGAVVSLSVVRPHLHCSSVQPTIVDSNPSSKSLRQRSSSQFTNGWQKIEGGKKKRSALCTVNALPDWPLMAVLVEHMEGQRDLITHKSIWHLNDATIKNIYTLYIMFTCWGCCFFGSVKDPFYDSEYYRKDGGDGSGHWVYEKQEDIEEAARAELWREELIEEIEQKVGGLRELEEAGKKREEVLK